MTLPLLARSGCRRQLATQTLLRSVRAVLYLLAMVTLPAHAQDPGTLNPQPLPPLPNPDAPKTPANELFGRKTTPLPGPPGSIGSYGDGCLAGAVALPISGPTWQVMRNRAIAIGEIRAWWPLLRDWLTMRRRSDGTDC